ncbi:hypothetical protein BH09DEP1_BH09DEP1_2280 [soil metagenome]
MLHSLITKIVLAATITISLPAMEENTQKIARLCQITHDRYSELDQNLLDLGRTLQASKVYEHVGNYYAAGTYSFFSYLAHPILNAQKCVAYFALARTINKKVYGTLCAQIVQTCDFDAIPDLTTDEQLQAQEKKEWDKEWPALSVKKDLESIFVSLQLIKCKLSIDKESLPLVEQIDPAIVHLEGTIETDLNYIEKSLLMIHNRKTIDGICQNPLAFIMSELKNGTLQRALASIAHILTLATINQVHKQSNSLKNNLIHDLSVQPLTVVEFKTALEIFKQSGLIGIDEPNCNNVTPLAYASSHGASQEIIQLMRDLGAKSALKSALKLSFDSPPASPEPHQGKKRTVRYNPLTKKE